jgi:aminoglycoside phosphotransferase (APT) family kinase protein
VCHGRMHADEVDIDEFIVRRLLTTQFPQWAELSIEPVASAGTDNALFRLGHDMVVRLPRIHGAVGAAYKESQWLPLLAPLLPVAIPIPLAKGTAAEGYPWEWAVYRWLEGESATVDGIADIDFRMGDIAQFVDALQQVDLPGGPPARRGSPLTVQDAEARAALAGLGGMIDTDAATVAWNEGSRRRDGLARRYGFMET